MACLISVSSRNSRQRFPSLRVGVGHHEKPATTVRSSEILSSESEPDRIVPERGKVTEHDVEPAKSEVCDVFHDDEARSKLANDSRELEPKAAARTADANLLASLGDVLAGEPAADDIDGAELARPDRANVVESLDVGPVLREDLAAELVALDLPEHGTESGPLEAEFESANAREE